MALSDSDSRLLLALGLAVESRKARRFDSDPSSSVEQSIKVAALLKKLGFTDPDVILAAVVRARLADGSTGAAEIERRLGSRVRALAEELVAPNQLDDDGRLEWVLKQMQSASASARAILLASVVVSLRHLPPTWTEARRAHYCHWVKRLGPLAPDSRFSAPLRDALLLARSARPIDAARATPPASPSTGGASRPSAGFLDELRRVQQVLGRVEERLGDVIESVDDVASPGPGPVPMLIRDKPKRPKKHMTPEAIAQATHGVGTVEFRAQDARTVLVSFDRGPAFELSRMLADLLKVISSGGGAASDGFIAFQSFAAVAAALVARGHKSSHRAVTVAINRLRDRLAEHHYPPLWVDTSEGVRLRLRVPAGDV